MLRRTACVGDKLSAGGIILPHGKPALLISGNPVAFIGGLAQCYACKSTGIIGKSGGPRRLLMSAEVALDSDFVFCKCSRPTQIIAAIAGENWYDDMAESGSGSVFVFDRFFEIKDKNGNLLPNIPYRITLEDGRQYVGRTNQNGQTRNIHANSSQTATIEAPYHGNHSSQANTGIGYDSCGH